MRHSAAIVLSLLAGGAGLCSAESLSKTSSAQKPPPPAKPVRTSDQFKQFLVTGGAFAQRVAVLRLAEELRETVLQAFGIPQESYPVARPLLFSIQTQAKQDTPPKFQVLEDPGGLKLHLPLPPLEEAPSNETTFQSPGGIKIKIGQPAPPRAADGPTERSILAALLTELALRPDPRSPSTITQTESLAPRWLVDALHHKHHHRDPVLYPILLRPLLESGAIPSPLPFLIRPEQDPTPSSPEEIDLARCLLSLFLSQADGRAGLLQLLRTDCVTSPLYAVQKCFPALGKTEEELQRQWTLAVASYGTQHEMVAFNGPRTDAEIQKLLQLEITDLESGQYFSFPMEQFADYLRLKGIRQVLLARQLEWIALREKGHFLYTEVAATYASICNDLAQGKTSGVAARFRQATLERESVSARLSRIRDHMNWFEAVAAPRNESPRMKEFYRILDERPPVSAALKQALDRAEEQVRQEESKADVLRALEESKSRSKPSR